VTPAGVAVKFPLAARSIATAIAVAGVSWLGIELTRATGSIAAIWPANAIVLSILLIAPTDLWPAYLFSGFLANAAANIAGGDAFPAALSLSSCNGVEILVAAAWLRRGLGQQPDLARLDALRLFALAAGLFAPLLSATLAAGYSGLAQSAPFFDVWRSWYLAHALGLLIFTPALMLVWSRRPIELAQPARIGSFIFVLALAVATALTVFSQHSYPLLLLIFPVLTLAIFLHGYSGAVFSILSITLVIAGFEINDANALTLPAALLPLSERILFLQFFVAVALFATLPIAVLIDQKKRLDGELRDSESRYRLLADNTLDLVVLADASLRTTYVSPAAKVVYGVHPERLVGQSMVDLVALEDADAVITALRRLYRAGDSATVSFRQTHAISGETVWIEARCRRMPDPVTGAAAGYLATLRDISAHKRAEAKLEEVNFQLEILASTDALTGIANRRCFDETLTKEWRRAMRSGESLSLLLLDVDRFKAYNDCYGHQAGDYCLKRIAVAMSSVIRRQPDLAARYGGEEFAVILPHTQLAGARYVAEQIVQAVRELATQHAAAPAGIVTVSIGVACLVPQSGYEPAELIDLADSALYHAKESGRNAVRVGLRDDASRPDALAPDKTLADVERAAQN